MVVASASAQRFVAYVRVSTARQGATGLGLEAQRKSIEAFAAARGAEVPARFTEVESGRKADRPELARALHLAKVTGATLVIAKLDRLSRHAGGQRSDCGDHGAGDRFAKALLDPANIFGSAAEVLADTMPATERKIAVPCG